MRNGIVASLFRDRAGHCLQILWNDEGRTDVFCPLPEVEKVDLIYLDGSQSALHAAGQGLTLGISPDPLLLLYEDAKNGLPDQLGEPRISIAEAPRTMTRTGTAKIVLEAATEPVSFSTPPFWDIQRDGLRFRVTPPRQSTAREGEMTASLPDGRGEIRFRVPISNKR